MLTNLMCRLGFTRDDAKWLYSRLVAAAALLSSGLIDLTKYGFTPGWVRAITVAGVVVLWLAGRYDSSPLPGDPKKDFTS